MAYSLLNKIWESTRLTSSEKANLLRRCYVGQDTETAITGIYISNARLAKDTGLCARTIDNTNRSLEAKGFLINDKPCARGKNNYSIPKKALEQAVNNCSTEETQCAIDAHPVRNECAPTCAIDAHKQLSNSVLSSKQLLEAKKTVENFVGDGTITLLTMKNRLFKMKKYGDIKASSMTCSFDDLCEQVILHVMNRNQTKTANDLHAFNSACKLIREGRWSKPIIREKNSRQICPPKPIEPIPAQQQAITVELLFKKQELGRQMVSLTSKMLAAKGKEKEMFSEQLQQTILEHSMIGENNAKACG